MWIFRVLLCLVSLLFVVSGSYADTFTVTNLDDSGTGSLRWAIQQANTNFGSDVIDFGVSGIISPSSQLTPIQDNGTIIDARSQWIGTWPWGLPGVTLSGHDAGNVPGIEIQGARNCQIWGLFVKDFSAGILLSQGAEDNFIGGSGVKYRNIISGNDVGVEIDNSDENLVSGNYIGTDYSGNQIIANSEFGIIVHGGSKDNTIGGTDPEDRNIISGNGNGISIDGTGTRNNEVIGNYIGVNIYGTSDIGNTGVGAIITNGASSNTIGGTVSEKRNIISGNNTDGVAISEDGTTDNIILGNYIGTDVSGTSDLGNSETGVTISEGASSNTIGGSPSGAGNLISGNNTDGIAILDDDTNQNEVSGNYIGTDYTGTYALGNGANGVMIADGASSNTIGGSTQSERNIISGNAEMGVLITGNRTDNNEVSGNYIGTDVDGTADIGNSMDGVCIAVTARSNLIEKNIISGNNAIGISIRDLGTDDNSVYGNYIGVNSTGDSALGNLSLGVEIQSGPQSNVIGDTGSGKRNIISGNNIAGVRIRGSNSKNNVISGNLIGTDLSGINDLGNSGDGVIIADSARLNTVKDNTISGNNGNGIKIMGLVTKENTITGNYIGINLTGTSAMGNEDDGIRISDGANYNIIGGESSRERNIISGNKSNGVSISNSGTDNNVVSGNYIGTDVTGKLSLGNWEAGVICDDCSATIKSNLIVDNQWGVLCSGTANPDLGGGGSISRGLNSIHDNDSYDVKNETVNTIKAEYNWWGTREPNSGQFSGDVDYDPWLKCPAGVASISDPDDLDVLREFRDKVMARSKTGRMLTEAYYQHASELTQILLQNPDLSLRSSVIIAQLMPGIRHLLGERRGRDIVMNSVLVHRIQELLSDIASEGSWELAQTLNTLSQLLNEYRGSRVSKILQ
jgi:hypothetical protein